jgi:hypothetical protein
MGLLALKGQNGPAIGPARLYSLATTGFSRSSLVVESDDTILIDFPNLPEEISLDRDTEWRVTPSPLLPDGFHVYDHTTPLSIPLSFKLHAFDDYSVNGPETLLMIAARLHALTLPIINDGIGVKRASTSTTMQNGSSTSTEATADAGTTKASTQGTAGGSFDSVTAAENQSYSFPPACVLDLMIGSGGAGLNPGLASGPALGIQCIGYVKSVRVLLKGPWLSSGDDSVNRNLPSAGDFSFVFVHAPSYTNSIANLQRGDNFVLPQVSAARMKNSFYNSADIANALSSIGYHGLLDVGGAGSAKT